MNEKPLGYKNYGSIPHLSNSKLGIAEHYIEKGQEIILTEKTRDKHDIIFAYEKYDGSNIGIAKLNNKIFALTRAGYEAKTSPFEQHHIFNDWVIKNEKLFLSILKNNERLAGEWMYQACGQRYNITGDPVLFFDYFLLQNRYPQTMLWDICQNNGLKRPRLLNFADPNTVNELLPILNLKTKEVESENYPEGIVFRVERKGKVDFLAKWIRPDYETGKYLNDNILNNLK